MNITKILHQVPIFSGLESSSIDKIAILLERENHEVDATIIEEGAMGDSLYIILNGSVRVTKFGQNHKEVLISNMESGSYFGELALLDNLPRSANVKTNKPTEVLRLRRESFDELLERNKEFAVLFYKNCLTETMARIRETATNLTMSQNVLFQKSSRLDMIDADLSNAKVIQDYFINTNLLEDDKPLISGVKQSYIYKPFIEVGGDFLNVSKLSENQLSIVIADVMGHGISAAMATGVMKSAFTLFLKQFGHDPVHLMNRMNAHFYEIFTTLYATCYYALIDMTENCIRMTKAGHNHPIIWKNDCGEFIKLETKGMGLGIIPDAQFEEFRVDIESGDKILFFTDGIVEQRNADNEMYSRSRLESKFVELVTSEEDNIVEKIYENLESFRDSVDFQDDISLLLLEF